MPRLIAAALVLALAASPAFADSAQDRYELCLADQTAIAQRGEHRVRPIFRSVDRICARARAAVLREDGRDAADGIRDARLQARFPVDRPERLDVRVRALPGS